jgi:hypothetical protein
MSQSSARGSIADSRKPKVGRLLDRQASLIEHLTSGAAIFDAGRGISIDQAPPGIDSGLLHLEARFSHEKRMAKIEWVLSRTFDLLGNARAAIIRDFVEACPPAGISRLENARQFHDFLSARWLDEAPQPPYLLDVAACELAYASVRSSETQARNEAARGGIRRHRNVILVRCSHDVRSILEGRVGEPAAAERDTPLAVSMPTGAEHPIVSELSPELFDLLEMLDDSVDLDAFANLPEVSELIADLAARGLLEVIT